MKAFFKKYWFNVVSIMLALGMLLYFALSHNGLQTLMQSLFTLNPLWILLAAGSMLVYWLLECVVFHLYTKHVAPWRRFSASVKTVMVGQLYSALTPFSSGGQPMQLVEMTRDGVGAGVAGSILTMKSIVYQVCMTVYAVLAVLGGVGLFTGHISNFWPLALAGLMINVFVSLLMVVFSRSARVTDALTRGVIGFLSRLRIVKDKQKRIERTLRQFDHFHQSTLLFEKSTRMQLAAYLLTFVQFTFYFLIPYCVYRAFGLVGAIGYQMVMAQAIVTMITAFIPLPGGSGGAEGSFYLFFSLFFSAATIWPALMVWRAITYYSCILFGALVTLTGNKTRRLPAHHTGE